MTKIQRQFSAYKKNEIFIISVESVNGLEIHKYNSDYPLTLSLEGSHPTSKDKAMQIKYKVCMNFEKGRQISKFISLDVEENKVTTEFYGDEKVRICRLGSQDDHRRKHSYFIIVHCKNSKGELQEFSGNVSFKDEHGSVPNSYDEHRYVSFRDSSDGIAYFHTSSGGTEGDFSAGIHCDFKFSQDGNAAGCNLSLHFNIKMHIFGSESNQ